MDKLKEHWPILAIGAFIVWAIYPAFLPVDQQNILEHPGDALQQKTASYRAAKSIYNTMLDRSTKEAKQQ